MAIYVWLWMRARELTNKPLKGLGSIKQWYSLIKSKCTAPARAFFFKTSSNRILLNSTKENRKSLSCWNGGWKKFSNQTFLYFQVKQTNNLSFCSSIEMLFGIVHNKRTIQYYNSVIILALKVNESVVSVDRHKNLFISLHTSVVVLQFIVRLLCTMT
jgi:hypothetical protein